MAMLLAVGVRYIAVGVRYRITNSDYKLERNGSRGSRFGLVLSNGDTLLADFSAASRKTNQT